MNFVSTTVTRASQGHLLNFFPGDGHRALETTVFKAQDSSDLHSMCIQSSVHWLRLLTVLGRVPL